MKLMATSFQWGNPLKRAPRLHFLPIPLKFFSMRDCPLPDEATSRLRFHVARYHLAIEIELRLLALVLRMEVSRFMLAVKHSNDNSKEGGDNRHGIQFTVRKAYKGVSN